MRCGRASHTASNNRVTGHLTTGLLSSSVMNSTVFRHCPLTERDCRILAYQAAGRTNEEIAAELGTTRHYVANLMQFAMAKLGATNRVEAVAMALREGWIS